MVLVPLAKTLVASDQVDVSHSVCHWCCHAIHGKVVGLPFRHKENPAKFICIAHPFCSFACARAYLHKEIRGSLQVRAQSLLPVLYKRMGGKLREYPDAAPPRNTLMLFGGTLTIAEFRNVSNDRLNVSISPTPIEFAAEYINVTGPPNSKHRLGTRIQIAGAAAERQPRAPTISIPNNTSLDTPGIRGFLKHR